MQYNEGMMAQANDTVFSANNITDLAVRDVQRRLAILGYDLGKEAEQGFYGEKTAAAVLAFKLTTQLPAGEVLDQVTWIALVDASLTIGDRVLYLHRPYFQGRDVLMLQRILTSLGFACTIDGVFNPSTEYALRAFQRSMALPDKGVLDGETLVALHRLRHAWEGKVGVRIEGRSFGSARAVAVLETQPICVYGVTATTRAVADRISNLAHATTNNAQVMSASSLTRPPGKDVLIVGLFEEEPRTDAELCVDGARQDVDSTKPETKLGTENKPCVVHYIDDEALASRIQAAIAASGEDRRIVIQIGFIDQVPSQLPVEQRYAIVLLDSLCNALAC